MRLEHLKLHSYVASTRREFAGCPFVADNLIE